jgi:hypothetical protein
VINDFLFYTAVCVAVLNILVCLGSIVFGIGFIIFKLKNKGDKP